MMAQLPNILVALLSTMVLNILYAFVAGIIFIKRFLKKKKNNIDITICEMTRNGIQVRNERGRREFVKDKGTMTFTVNRFNKRIKDNLGYNIRDEDCYISTMGTNRKYLFVAMKDKLIASFQEVEKSVDWTDAEKKQLKALEDKVKAPGVIKISEIPEKLSLSPLVAEQARFMLDIEKDKADMYKTDERDVAKKMLYASAGIFFFTLIICLVVLVVTMNQAPSLASAKASAVATTAKAIVPGAGMLPG